MKIMTKPGKIINNPKIDPATNSPIGWEELSTAEWRDATPDEIEKFKKDNPGAEIPTHVWCVNEGENEKFRACREFFNLYSFH